MTFKQSGTDPYLPGHGDASYEVVHYDLALDYAVGSNALNAKAAITVRALQETGKLRFDLHGLKVVKLSGPRGVRHRQSREHLTVELPSPLTPGKEITLSVTYRGNPHAVRDRYGEAGWEELTDGLIVASQPGGAPSWFPCNDRPDNKASYRITVTTDSDYRVIANGVLVDTQRRAGSRRWTYEMSSPMASYLATVQIGRYDESSSGRTVPIFVAATPQWRERARKAFADQRDMLDLFVRCYGPYPFERYGVVITDDPLEIPLEAQGLSIFGSNLCTRDWDSQRLIAHEMSHQWFGNAVTMKSLQDIWLHEGFACYSEWLWSQESGGPSSHAQAQKHYDGLRAKNQDLVLGDPGPDDVFDDRVYKRGALTLHAIRLAVGDVYFFGLLRAWVAARRGGNVTTQDFVEFATEHTGHPIAEITDRWVYQTALPNLPEPSYKLRNP